MEGGNMAMWVRLVRGRSILWVDVMIIMVMHVVVVGRGVIATIGMDIRRYLGRVVRVASFQI